MKFIPGKTREGFLEEAVIELGLERRQESRKKGLWDSMQSLWVTDHSWDSGSPLWRPRPC